MEGNMRQNHITMFIVLMIITSVLAVIPAAQAATPEEINNAINKGLAWLATQQNADGSWGTSDRVARTALAVLKFETHATLQGKSPFDPDYPYHEQVKKGLNFIFTKARITNIGNQIHDGIVDDPDTNGNGIGVYFYDTSSHHTMYETGIALMAIAASNAPNRVVNVSGSSVNGWTYKDVAQDTVDYLAWGQTDSGYGRGGWNYEAMNNAGSRSDNSNTGYVVLGLGYAEAAPPWGFGLTIPEFVRRELNIYINYIQCKTPGTNHGGSGYTSPCSWVNMLKTGNLLYEMAFVGDNVSTQRVKDALNYTVRHWNDTNMDPGWKDGATTSHYQATYTTMKGLEVLGINTIDGIDWFDDFSDEIVAEQNADGSWPTCPCYCSGGWCHWCDSIICTEWALLTLQRAVPPVFLSLSPVSDKNPICTTHTLTAKLVNATGAGIPGVTITFKVIAGPHAGTIGTNVTGPDGKATWSYMGTTPGIDTIVATGANKTSNKVFKTWTPIELCPDEYRWGSWEWDPYPTIFVGRQEVHFVNNGSCDVYNVTAMVTCTPVNIIATDPNVTIGDIPAGSGAWSKDTFELRVDMTNPQDPNKGICWRVEYDDAYGNHHVIEDVAKYCGENCSDICP